MSVVYDDSLAAALTKVLSYQNRQWYRVDEYQFFGIGVQFDTTGFADGIGLTSADTVEISCEFWFDDSRPANSDTGFLNSETLTRTVLATYDSTNIVDNPKTIIPLHGPGDPEIIFNTAMRFYVRVVGGFTSGGLGFKVTFGRQP